MLFENVCKIHPRDVHEMTLDSRHLKKEFFSFVSYDELDEEF